MLAHIPTKTLLSTFPENQDCLKFITLFRISYTAVVVRNLDYYNV